MTPHHNGQRGGLTKGKPGQSVRLGATEPRAVSQVSDCPVEAVTSKNSADSEKRAVRAVRLSGAGLRRFHLQPREWRTPAVWGAMGEMAWNLGTGRLRRIVQRRDTRRGQRADRRPRATGPSRSNRVPWGMVAASLPGLAALLALLFTWMQVAQTGKELAIIERGQITSRFNTAIGNLGSASLDVRLGGIYALERIMHDSARDQPTVVSVLSAYARQHAPAADKPPPVLDEEPPAKADIQAAVTVLGNRRPDRDQKLPIDLSHTALRGIQLTGDPDQIHFHGVDLTEADLGGASLYNVDLREAYLNGANLSGAALEGSRLDGASLYGADLRDANLTESNFDAADLSAANLTGAGFCTELVADNKVVDRRCANLTYANLTAANLTEAHLVGVNLAGATFCPDPTSEYNTEERCANLAGAILSGVNLKGAYLSGANLKGADLTGADLTGANLTGADLTGADLTGAKIAGAKFERAKLEKVRGMDSPS